MSCQAFQDALDLQIGLLEITGEFSPASYPYPTLEFSGPEDIRRFETVVLENDLLRATFVPGLGGRLLRLFDKRSQTECLPVPTTLLPTPGGPRGVCLPYGIEVVTDLAGRPNALGRVDSAVSPPDEEDGAARVWLAESAGGAAVGWTLLATLRPDAATVDLEVRFGNRELEQSPFRGGLWVPGPAVATEGGAVFWDPIRAAGLAVLASATEPIHLEQGDGGVYAVRRSGALAARQQDTVRFQLVPISGLGRVSGASRFGAWGYDANVIELQVTEHQSGAKLFVLTGAGETLEAEVDLDPAAIKRIELPPDSVAVTVRDARRNDLFVADLRAEAKSFPAVNPVAVLPDAHIRSATLLRLHEARLSISVRSTALTILAKAAASQGDFPAAAELAEQALLFNGDDPIGWWALAAYRRRLGATDESPELLNAHYLAPLEPLLRAEAFLSQPVGESSVPNPLVTPLTEVPENLVEVAAQLLETGLREDAARWIDEALRHRNLGALHLLLAFAYLDGSRMDAQAAMHLDLAKRAEWPPYPYRPIERDAIRGLQERGFDVNWLPELARHP